jgi:hypothetical protein
MHVRTGDGHQVSLWMGFPICEMGLTLKTIHPEFDIDQMSKEMLEAVEKKMKAGQI